MSFDGIEIDMLSLGNADSILVTRWKGEAATRVLIDGGNSEDSEKVLAFLESRGVAYINHIVCSHPHDDHVCGLIGIVKSSAIDFGDAWVHLPWKHIDREFLTAALNENEASAKRVVQIIRASLESTQELVSWIAKRQKPIFEPFKGSSIGFLHVCGPSQQHYELLLKDFADYEKLRKMEESIASYERQNIMESLFEGTTVNGKALEGPEPGLGNAPTEPENNSSTILWAKHLEDTMLFTADAGVEALSAAKEAYNLAGLRWMQIPHHGSRRNVNESLIGYLKPKTAFVSADGTRKHPRRAVVNAFKAVGAKVFSTHYPSPGGNKWFHLGIVPERPDYSSAVPLYEADE